MILEFYLRIQRILKHLTFYINKYTFSFVQHLDRIKYTSSFSRNIQLTLLYHLLTNTVFAYFLLMADGILYAKFPSFPFQHEIFLNVTIGGLGIAGVILGLYCSNMATIYSSKYTNAPNSLAQTFRRDIITNQCMRQIVGYIIISVILVLECMMEFPLYYVSVLAYLLLTMRMIITFSIAGNRSYYFSDTFQIAGILYPELLKYIQRVSNQKRWSKDINFQSHFQKLCDRSLMVMTDISEYNKQNPENQNSAMLDFMKKNLFLLQQYWRTKPGISYNSYWWKKQADYPQWHRASDTEVSIALQTGTTLQTKEKPNYCWFEEAIEKINGICFDKLCHECDFVSIYNYLAAVSNISDSAIDPATILHWISYVGSLHKKVLSLIIKCSGSESAKAPSSVPDEAEQLTASISDIISLNFISLLVGINKYLASIDIPALHSHVISRQHYHSLDLSRYPFLNQEMIEKMYQHIEVETAIENQKVTPDWFIIQTSSLALSRYLNTLIETMIQMHANLLAIGKQLIKQKCYFQAALIFSRFPEVDSKSTLAIQHLEPLLTALKETHIEKNTVWCESRLEELKETLTKTKRILPQYLISCSRHVTLDHWTNRTNYPDLLGQCYNYLCEYILSSIETDDFELFKASYKDFFSVMLLYQEYVRTDIVQIKERHLQQSVFRIFAVPVLEFSKLSGFAILWGEFSKNPDWKNFVEAELNSFIKNTPTEAITILEQITEIAVTAKRPLLGIGNRSLLHTKWEQRITAAIRQSEFFQVTHGPYFSAELVTESKIIKTFCRSFEYHLASDSEDIYFLLCVNPHLDEDKKFKSRYQWEDEHELL